MGNPHSETSESSYREGSRSLTNLGSVSNGASQDAAIQQPVEQVTSISQLAPAVAICGIGLRLPGGVSNGDEFWELLQNGIDARTLIPATRYNIGGFDDSLGAKDAIRVKHGYFLDQDLSGLDTSFFTLTKSELEKTDPQQRLLLEVTRECLEDAGETNYRGQVVGCYVGTFGDDWLFMSAKESQQGGGYTVTGHGDLMLANRVSYEYDLRGPRCDKSQPDPTVILSMLTYSVLAWLSRPVAQLHSSLCMKPSELSREGTPQPQSWLEPA